ncbi:MAG: ABC transporter ATP-binding protein [Candidatus Omnitrophota bacterium]
MTLLKAESVTGGYGREPVIKDISFSAASGKFIGIIGPNGAGKTTFLRMLSRVLHPSAGRVAIDGKDIYRMPMKEFAASAAFVASESGVIFPFTCLEIVMMGRFPYLHPLRGESEKDLEAVRRAIEMTDCSAFVSRQIDQLSAGERQRIFIARALAQEPRLIFLDEPTSHLDISHQVQILDLIKDLSERGGITIVAVFHDLNLASEYCDTLMLMDGGRVAALGEPKEVISYELIEKVYKTVVVVRENPVSGKPYVLLAPRIKKTGKGI